MNKMQRWNALRQELAAIHEEWNAVSATYEDEGPVISMSDEGWEELTQLTIVLKDSTGQQSFAQAWADTLIPARSLLTDRFATWAAAVVKLCGLDKFPIDCGDPQPLTSEYKWGQQTLAQALTGSSDAVEAGLRVTFWGAAYRDPAMCRRTYEHGVVFWRWTSYLMQFGGGCCGTSNEVFSWIWAATEYLHLANSNTPGDDGVDETDGEGVPIESTPEQLSAVDGNELSVLKFLQQRAPTLIVQLDIAENVDLSRSTVGPTLQGLERKKLVHRPRGERSGYGLTDEGIRLAERLRVPRAQFTL